MATLGKAGGGHTRSDVRSHRTSSILNKHQITAKKISVQLSLAFIATTYIVFRPGSSFINPESIAVAVSFAVGPFIGTGPVDDGAARTLSAEVY